MIIADANGSRCEPKWRVYNDGRTFELKVFVFSEAEGGFSVVAARLPGLASQGETVEEALGNIVEAASILFEEYGDDIPWVDEESPEDVAAMEKWVLVDG